MADLDTLLGTRHWRKLQKQSRRGGASAKFDAAQTTLDNQAHWANADGLSAAAANSPEVRRVLRNRSRYEDANNPNARGLQKSLVDELVGTGPRLQLTLSDADFGVPVAPEISRHVEMRWKKWCKAIGLTQLLRTGVWTEVRDGEVFNFLFMNPGVADGVQLAVRQYEGDQIATPDLSPAATNAIDGIVFDEYGNPKTYHVLKAHPGDTSMFWQTASDYDRIPAWQMVHLFEQSRPGQRRGIPELASALQVYSVLRRWTGACLLSAEAQARINAVIEQEYEMPGGGLGSGEDDDDGAGEQIQYAGTHILTLASGQKAKVLPHSSPPAGYKEFKAENLTEAGRALGAPRNVSTGSSAEYNYSSGRLDQQGWQRGIRCRRDRTESCFLDKLLREWAALALLAPGYLLPGTPPVEYWNWLWRWDGFNSIDPFKDARAATERLDNGTSSLDRECGELGADWEEIQDQRLAEESREIRRRRELGLPPREVPAPTGATTPQRGSQRPQRQEEEDD